MSAATRHVAALKIGRCGMCELCMPCPSAWLQLC